MRFTRQILILALSSPLWVTTASAQFTSGSTGADGAYSPTASGDFDPTALGLDPSGDNVFNFTTINIPAGVTIKLRASKLRNAAVTWLATGDVTIAGTLDLSGATPVALNTNVANQVGANRILPEPGPGGYTGGLGSLDGVGPQAGAGPGGGPAGLQNQIQNDNFFGADGSFINSGVSYFGRVGLIYSSYLLTPLYGGSGGGGGWSYPSALDTGGIGGAGGGAIRIASSTQINVTGLINANGGTGGTVSGSTAGGPGGAGAGGAIHLIAPTILGNGSMTVSSGTSKFTGTVVTTGIVRFSTNTNGYVGTATGGVVLGPLFVPPANSTPLRPRLRSRRWMASRCRLRPPGNT